MKKQFLYLFIALFMGIIIGGCGGKTDKQYMESAAAKVKDGKVEEGIEDYKIVVQEFEDSELAPVALKEIAVLYQQGRNYSAAVDAYRKLIDNYPDSKYVPESLYQLALLYQNKLVENVSDQEALEKSAELYRRIYDEHPESEKAATALFMSGFILSNELNNYDEATETYKLFLEKYPDHDLSVPAKEELDYMGLSPEEILEKKSKGNL